jgi:hypothetical protein
VICLQNGAVVGIAATAFLVSLPDFLLCEPSHELRMESTTRLCEKESFSSTSIQQNHSKWHQHDRDGMQNGAFLTSRMAE